MSLASESHSLPGGVSCEVWIERDVDGREIVIKQPLAKLKVVADWRSNPERYDVEVRALAAVRHLLGNNIAPKVIWADAAKQRFSMERIDSRLRNWKSDLLAQHVDLVTASRAGELLGLLHSRSANHLEYAVEFGNRGYFEELRIEPFFKRIAQRNPSLAVSVELVIAALREPGIAFVHGDYSPKNLLVDGPDVVILDLEVAHWGNPRFDVAFCLTHLILKGQRRDVLSLPYKQAALAFVRAYREHGMPSVLDAILMRILGCLLLARLEGDSPVDYLIELDRVHVKNMAIELLTKPTTDIALTLETCFG